MRIGLNVFNVLTRAQARVATPVVNSVRTYAADAKASPTEVSSILEQRIRGVHEEAGLAETGRVLSVGYVGTKHIQCTQRLIDPTVTVSLVSMA